MDFGYINSLNEHYRRLFGDLVYKVSINAGFSCPNLDGTISAKGCLFCNNLGYSPPDTFIHLDIERQIDEGLKKVHRKYGCRLFLGYFQNFTNTYADPAKLRMVYDHVLRREEFVGLAVSTRPDSLADDIIGLFVELRERTFISIEVGLQSRHDRTLDLINRGHHYSDFVVSVKRLQQADLEVCAHIIIGLPGESEEMMIETVLALNDVGVSGVKFHNLQVVEGTELADWYRRGEYRPPELDRYIHLLVTMLEHLDPGIVVHRLKADTMSPYLLAPSWPRSMKKSVFIELVRREMNERATYQGRCYKTFAK